MEVRVEAVELIINLLEKVAVLVATALFLLLLRPAEVWLTERGHRASPRRRLFLIAVFAPMAVWGIFLGFDIGGMGFNTRTIGIIVSGYLGGRAVGAIVGAIAGAVYVTLVPDDLAMYVFLASVLDGLLAGYWAKRFGMRLSVAVIGAVLVQLAHHAVLGGVFALFDLVQALHIASNVGLHAAKIGANTIGVFLFMGMLTLLDDLQRARRQAVVSADQVRSARLEALQYQLQPHFLFNLLNTLAYLIRTNPARARELTLDLSEFLRYTLSREDTETSLGEELEQLERYVDLERARFGEGLRFSVRCDPPELSEELHVPPLILQPLVENAIRHGAREGRVEVHIEASRGEEGVVTLEVLDDGPGPSETRRGSERRRGVGLQNVRERLERYYEENASLTLERREEGEGARAVIRIGAPQEEPGARSLISRLRRAILPELVDPTR